MPGQDDARQGHTAMDKETITRGTFVKGAVGVVGGASFLGLAAACGSKKTSSGARRGGVIEFAIGSTLVNESVDPQHTFDANEDIYVTSIYEMLCEMDTSWAAQPRLAESWQPNADLTEWTFNIRKGVKFHDGETLTSRDPAFTLHRILDPKTGSIHLAAWARILDREGIQTPDATRLVLKLKRPSAMPPVLFSYRGSEIVRDGATDLSKHANGTGPFKLRSFTAGQNWEVVRNPNYWKKGLPYLEGMRGLAATDPAAKIQSVLSGSADITDTIDYALAKTVSGSKVADLIRDPARTEMYVVADVREKPFNDPRVRLALKYAIDRELILKTAYQGNGVLTSDTVAPLGNPFYPPDLGVRAHNVQKAKQLLSEAGYPNGIDFVLHTANIIGGIVDMNVAMSQTLTDAGIHMKIDQGPGETYYTKVWRQVPVFVDWIVKRHLAPRLPLTFTSDAVWPQSHYPHTPIDGMFEKINLKPDDPSVYAAPLSWIANNDGYFNPGFGDGLTVRKKRVKDLRIRKAGDYVFEHAYVAS